MPSPDQFDEGVINRPGVDPLPPRVAEDPFDSLASHPSFAAVPYGPDPVLLTPDPGT